MSSITPGKITKIAARVARHREALAKDYATLAAMERANVGTDRTDDGWTAARCSDSIAQALDHLNALETQLSQFRYGHKSARELVAYVKNHAEQNYAKGWSVVVECWDDAEIEAELVRSGAQTPKQAIAAFKLTAELYHERCLDARNSI